MENIKKTIFYDKHLGLKGTMVDFAGWDMPVQYPSGIIAEHLATRKGAGLFDVSHMGRFVFRGENTLPFLQHVLTNNAAALDIGHAQYTIIPDETGGAIDDAYLYRFYKDEYLLVVNASNTQKDRAHFWEQLKKFKDVGMSDIIEDLVMLSLQGPLSKSIMNSIIEKGSLPEPMRNMLSIATINGTDTLIARTGYTGEPVCFELFIKKNNALKIWDLLIEKGAVPIGLGARDTLRLEAGLPLYGHELGTDIEGKEIPIFSISLAKFAVSFSPSKGDFIGKEALFKQFEALQKFHDQDYSLIKDLPKLVKPLALTDKGIARAGYKVFYQGKHTGYITSGTAVPYYKVEGEGILSKPTEEKETRAICLALVESNINTGDTVQVEIRDKKLNAVIVPYHLKSETPPYARPILYSQIKNIKPGIAGDKEKYEKKAAALLEKAIDNTVWRQQECINLIPSEQTLSSLARMLSVMDPAFRYAEHKRVKALYDVEVFYYQGCEFIEEIEKLLEQEFCKYMGCKEAEMRPISGQMANMIVYSAIVDYLNRADRKSEPRRIRSVLNNHIIKGGHLSGQPMGGLKDFIARAPLTEMPAVVSFPALKENPYKTDVEASRDLIAQYKPELIILGKSMVLHPEPVEQIHSFVNELSPKSIIMYDMAHVLGLVGPHFQEPFKEGVDIVTGSTHKTFFGTQRGVIASGYDTTEEKYELWEAVRRRAFPGFMSNHHLGTMLGLLMAAYEMNCFKDEYQKKVISNAKAFAGALKNAGMTVAGDPAVSFTETHQVIVNVGYAKGPEIAKRLQDNNIIVNYQATSDEEGFTASGSIRLGVSEMTRFGMEQEDFVKLAHMVYEVVVKNINVKEEVKTFRKKFTHLRFCFSEKEFNSSIDKLHKLI